MATVFFYLLIAVILHALIQEYILDVSTSLTTSFKKDNIPFFVAYTPLRLDFWNKREH